MSTPGPTTLTPSGWYVVPDHANHRHTLLTGLGVNGLDGWDVTKLGWLKAGKKGKYFTSSLDQLRQHFHSSVESCSQGKYSGRFVRTMIDHPDIGGRMVTQEYPFLSDIHVWQRHVEMKHKESPLLGLTLQHRSKVGVTVQYSTSHLAEFSGVLYQDRSSHTHLNLSLYNSAGTITGLITGTTSSQSFIIRLPDNINNYTQHVKLTTMECENNQVTITLSTVSLVNNSMVKKIPCLYQNMRSFTQFSATPLQPGDGGAGVDCLSCGSSWLHWLDPQHWMETVWPQTRVVVLVTMLSLGIILTVILCRVARQLHHCCRRSNSKKVDAMVLRQIERVVQEQQEQQQKQQQEQQKQPL